MEDGIGDRTGYEGCAMIRELAITAAVAGAALGLASAAAANPYRGGPYDTDVPGINYEASLGAPCDNWELFIFGRGPDGQAEACHYVGKQNHAYWMISYPLYGVQQIGTPCDNPRSAAQSPDGVALVCAGQLGGWQPGPPPGSGPR